MTYQNLTRTGVHNQELPKFVVPRKYIWSLRIFHVLCFICFMETFFTCCVTHSLCCFLGFCDPGSLCFFTDRKQLRKTSFFSDLSSSENCGLLSRYMLQKQSRRLPNNSTLSLEKSPVLPICLHLKCCKISPFSDSMLFLLSNYHILVNSSKRKMHTLEKYINP